MNQDNENLFMSISTREPQVFKSVSKTLYKYFTDSTFMINSQGIYIQEGKEDMSVLFESFFRKEQFDKFIIPKFEDPNATIILGFSTKEMEKALEGVTKTDNLRIYVRTDDTNNLHLHITNESKGKNSYKFIRLKKTKICNIISLSYKDSDPTAVVHGPQYKKGMTEINKAASKIKVRLRAQENGMIVVPPDNVQISAFREVWGNYIDGQQDIYDEQISTAKLHAVSELASITKNIKIYACGDGKPLKIALNAGQLGTIAIYLQPDQQVNGPVTNNNMIQ
jgi:hypothetical protein